MRGIRFTLLLTVLGLAVPGAVLAQAWVPQKGSLMLGSAYQYMKMDKHLLSQPIGDPPSKKLDLGDISSQSLNFSLDYGVTNALAISANVAFVASRYVGDDPESELDDGTWNEGFQDFSFAARYMFSAGSFLITPVVGYGAPTQDYGVIGHASLGRGLQEGRLGVSVGWMPGFLPNSFAEAGYSYALIEDIEGWDENLARSDVGLQVGTFFSRVSVRGFGSYRNVYGGIDWVTDLTDEHFHAHDQGAATRDLTVGGGVGYAVAPQLGVFASFSTTAWGENTHEGTGFSLGTSYLFPIVRN